MKRRMASLAAICLTFLGACGGDPDPLPTVALVRAIRGSLELSRGESKDPVEHVTVPARAERNARVQSGEEAHGSLDLDNGSWLLIGPSTAFTVGLDTLQFEKGRLWLDAGVRGATTIVTEYGELEATDGSLSVESDENGAIAVMCASGEVTYRADDDEGQFVQGETLRLTADGAVVEATELWSDWTGGLADPSPRLEPSSSFVGTLVGRAIPEWGVAPVALPTRSYDVRATVLGDYVETVVTQTFFNARSEEIETEYTITLPKGAIVKGFAVNQGTGAQVGRIAIMEQGERYRLHWDERESVTSRLIYDGPGKLRARIYPVAAGSVVRVVVRYGEWLERRGDQRSYVLPMRSELPSPMIGELSIRVDTTQAGAGAYRAGMGAKVEDGAVLFRASDIRPNADFYLDLIDEEPRETGRVVAYEDSSPAQNAGSQGPGGRGRQAEQDGDRDSFVMFDVASEDLDLDAGEAVSQPVDLVLLVDSSGGTSDEDLELARASVDALLRFLTPRDRVALRYADVDARVPAGVDEGFREASPALREQYVAALASAKRGGATDLATSLRSAAALLRGKPKGVVLYLGDGLPTTGALTKTEIQEVLSGISSPPRFFALGLGAAVNGGLLEALFQERYRLATSEREAAKAVADVLSELAHPVIRGVSFSPGEEVERLYPSHPLEVPAGAHIRLIGRLRGKLPEEIVVRGSFLGEVFERRLPVVRKAVADNGDIQRRWATARLAELLDQSAGREALVDLGSRYSILTPWTAFVTTGASQYRPIRGFDTNPSTVRWARAGGALGFEAFSADARGGWRRRQRSSTLPTNVALSGSWFDRVPTREAVSTNVTGDGGLARAQVRRALRDAERGPRGCFERKQLVRPELAGNVQVNLSVNPNGSVKSVEVSQSSLSAPDVERCIERELVGLRYPATGTTVNLNYTFLFHGQIRAMGAARECSRLSRLELFQRRRLWNERLSAVPGVQGALDMWQRAKLSCELDSWRAKQALLEMLLTHVGRIHFRIAFYKAFEENSEEARYLRRLIVQGVTDPGEIAAIRDGLGINPEVDWRVFERDWKKDDNPRRRLALVERWLKVLPNEIDLLLRKLSLLEDLERLSQARRLARQLVREPLCDARVLTDVGEFWLRSDNSREARRVFSELVERAPFDPWARKRLGDLYRAHGWFEDAYREYATLTRLDPSNRGVRIDLARAAAGAGRLHEALMIEQALAESSELGASLDLGGVARMWTEARLSRQWKETVPEARGPVTDQIRSAGILRDPPALVVMLTWPHPDDRPSLQVRFPGRALLAPATAGNDAESFERAPEQAPTFGIEAVRIREREPESYLFEVRRDDKERIRDVTAEVLLWVNPGQPDARVLTQPVTLTRSEPKLRFQLTPENTLEVSRAPAN